MKPQYQDKDWLYNQYIEKEKCANEIAEKCNVTNVTILNWLRKFNISIRDNSEAGKISFKKGRSISHGFGIKKYRPIGKNHGSWTGKKGSDSAKRSYINTHNKKLKYCSFCGKGNCKISFCFDHYKGKHTRNIEDYKQLCDKCHLNRDYYEFGIHTKTNDDYKKFKLICECGVNFHNLDEAKEMIKESKKIKAFGCKFQIYSEEQIKGHEYEKELNLIRLDNEKVKELYDYGKRIKQRVIFTCMTEESIDWCNKLNIKYCKIRHLDQYNYPLLWKAFLTNITYFISTDYFIPFRTKFIPLFCIPKYPANIKDYKVPKNIFYQGISDHTPDLELLIKTIKEKRLNYFEKHVKLNEDCIEAKWSVTFEELAEVLK